MGMRPTPYTEGDVLELMEEDPALVGLLVRLDNGKLYNVEDLYSCDGCDFKTADPADLSEISFCPPCEKQANEDEQDIAIERRMARFRAKA